MKQVERRLHPTELGKTVDSVLRQNFPDIVDIAFTADLERRLDSVEEGTREYEPTVRELVRAVRRDTRARRTLDGASPRPGTGDRRGVS